MLHEKAVAKLRAQLFKKHPPDAYFIVPGSEGRLPPIASVRVSPYLGDVRSLSLGGLTYDLTPPGFKLVRMTLVHSADDWFNLALFNHLTQSSYTMIAVAMRFREIEKKAIGYFPGAPSAGSDLRSN